MTTRNDLARVVREILERRPVTVTYEHLAARAPVDPPLTTAYISKVANGTIQRPPAERLRALAVALDTPYETLRDAMDRPEHAAIAQPEPLPQPGVIVDLSWVPRTPPLTPAQIARIRAVVAEELAAIREEERRAR